MANGGPSIRDAPPLLNLTTDLLKAISDNRQWEAVVVLSGALMVLTVAVCTNGPPLEGLFFYLIVLATIFAIIGLTLGITMLFNNNRPRTGPGPRAQPTAGFIFLAAILVLLAAVMYAGGFEVKPSVDIIRASLKVAYHVLHWIFTRNG
ncbi:unnamed protein product [Urochloa humidicola]